MDVPLLHFIVIPVIVIRVREHEKKKKIEKAIESPDKTFPLRVLLIGHGGGKSYLDSRLLLQFFLL